MALEILVRILGRHSIEVQRVDKNLDFALTPKVRYEILQTIEKQLEEAALCQHGNNREHLDARLGR